MLKELKEDVEKIKKTTYEQNENINRNIESLKSKRGWRYHDGNIGSPSSHSCSETLTWQ